MSSRARRIGLFLLGVGTVAALGALVLRDQVIRHRRDLFSSNPVRRLAALRHLNGEPATVDAITVLRDFSAWEPRRLLRNQAAAVLERMESELRHGARSA
ncbi:MAG: hypothetical protein F4139_07880 [Gemmatimonadetes bacterium]|nr:hypothetical protein [Gemmatimonadota bacterium]MYA64150.1 hypothetical protein [Gemmatimonadota bacterium]MYB98768.1 hypothetical protein [Gemmatimonadota bacterium]MYH52854.1 hypothetical protein [Gemmatimonadota bacterium]MYI46198.1 hypothetical protein [Gemmatimonadota bacterium]